MKVLFAALRYDYGDAKRGPSFEYANFWDTLRQMPGLEAELWPIDELISQYGRDEMNRRLLDKVKAEQPDVLFCFLFNDEIKPEVIKEITHKTKTVTVNWFGDDQQRWIRYSRLWAPLFSWVVTTDAVAMPKYAKLGLKQVILSQYGCNHFAYKPIFGEIKYDASFVGLPHSNRRLLANSILKAGINLECFGGGWPRGRVLQQEMIEIFSASKINLNFAQTAFGVNWKTLARIFLSRQAGRIRPNSLTEMWLNIRQLLDVNRLQIKGRNFEIPGCGGFLLTTYTPDLNRYYELEKEVVTFKSQGELIDKIKYYLHHESERRAVAEAGYRRTLRDHTYSKRFSDIFSTIGFDKPQD